MGVVRTGAQVRLTPGFAVWLLCRMKPFASDPSGPHQDTVRVLALRKLRPRGGDVPVRDLILNCNLLKDHGHFYTDQ